MFMYESSVNGWLQDRNEVLYSNSCHAVRGKDWYFVSSQRGTTQSLFMYIVLSVSFLCLGNDVLLRQGY